MSVTPAPWEWDCACGQRNNAEHAFCWSCGRPSHAGRMGSTYAGGSAFSPHPHPMTAPPTATFTTPFHVVDERGRLVMSVESGPNGGVLNLCNGKGTPVVSIRVVEGGGAVIVTNDGGRAVVSLASTRDGGAVGVNASTGEPRAALGTNEAGGYVGVSAPGVTRSAQIRGAADGGRLVLYDARGRPMEFPPRSVPTGTP
ncbi:MAG: hypothetical protein K0Q72_1653 [Armatimonadetes bacterium]|nr:hypothetical protein [Armatimonadota bacterium]